MNKLILIIIIGIILVGGIFAWQYLVTEEITITTDKKEYERGEKIEIIIKNNNIRNIEYRGCGLGEYQFPLCWLILEQFEDEKWISIRGGPALYCSCGAYCEPPPRFISEPRETITGTWNQSIWWCEEHVIGGERKKSISLGKYRIIYEDWEKTIYSNEFIVK